MTGVENKNFKDQLGNVHKVESFGGTARYLYLKPETLKEGSLPVLIAGGWSEGIPSLQDTAEVVCRDGREAILVDHARTGGPTAEEVGRLAVALNKDLKIPSEIPVNPEVAHKARTLLTVLEDANVRQVDVIAHSEASLNVIYAALQQPERFRNIVLTAPAGMIGEDDVMHLAGRFARKVVRGMTIDMREIKARDPESAKRFAKAGPEYLKSNVKKSLREVKSIATTRVDQLLNDPRLANIKFAILQSNKDHGFPAKKIGKQVVIDELKGNVDAYASVASRHAGHDDLIIHPDRSTKAALKLLDQLQNYNKLNPYQS